MTSPNIPLATYRLQFNRNFTFRQATELVPYLAALGISHCYASPYLRARPGSMHGYDIIDHNSLNPEIGTPEEYDHFVHALQAHGMGQILDIVPNHMGVMGSDNAWWLDVLENGQASTYSDFFDIDWQPVKDELQSKVLIPILGDQYGTVLDRGELKLTFDCEKGEFSIFYFQHRFPVNPREYPRILEMNLERIEQQLGAENRKYLELRSLSAAFSHLPGRFEESPEKKAERTRDKEIHKRRLAQLCAESAEIDGFIRQNVSQTNGTPGNPRSFDALHELIKTQAYRLAYWRVASDDINYRRFFDINDLAALRMENPAVFEATHRFVLQLVREGKLNGLRVDHPDGLYDPAQYFQWLQSGLEAHDPAAPGGSRPVYLVIEKILSGNERLPTDWPVYGTTGYEFANQLNGLFVNADSAGRMDRVYRAFLGAPAEYDSVLYASKKLVVDNVLASEVNVLAHMLSRIALANRHTCDFTLNGLREAIGEVAVNFPVYRTYITAGHVSGVDRGYIERAVTAAKHRSNIAETSVFDFIREVLLTRIAERHSSAYGEGVLRFAMKFQQFSSVVMAKGLEDTCFYRYYRLTSLNEVGGDPRTFGLSPRGFHEKTLDRAGEWPFSLLATSTHDSKRSEDVRARINVLSEIPAVWRSSVRRWHKLNLPLKPMVDGSEAPSRNDEYLFYQSLIGAWPLQAEAATPEFCSRIKDYMLKAVREAKLRTSWANPNQEYENAVSDFVCRVLAAQDFVNDFLGLQKYVSRIGLLNSLSQLLIKLTAPGVPDIYQGNELWDFSLVDPDNRRPVDYSVRRRLLQELQAWSRREPQVIAGGARDIAEKMLNGGRDEGRAKLYVTAQALALRRRTPALFRHGAYLPLEAEGEKSDHLFAFARRHENSCAVIAVPRLCVRLLSRPEDSPLDATVWRDTALKIPLELSTKGKVHNVFTGESGTASDRALWTAASLFANFPLALLVSESR